MFRTNVQSTTAKFASILCFVLAAMLTQPAQAQTFTVLHEFTGEADGSYPDAGLTMDRAGNLYGTTYGDGYSNSSGSVFELTRTNGVWTFAPIYTFTGGNDGALPYAGVVIGPDGSLYGTTTAGGAYDNGTVFNLRPPPHFCSHVLCDWTETVLYSFQGGSDGSQPYGSVAFDQAGNIYGTTFAGGGPRGGDGTVYRLAPSGSGWTESVIYAFSNSDGANPLSGVTLDNAGNLYGTTVDGGAYGDGAVYELTYSAGSGWAESFLHSFNRTLGAGECFPYDDLIFDPSGNLYGAAAGGEGAIFKLTPSAGSWTYSLLYGYGGSEEACGARGNLAMDGAGNIYGTTYCDGAYAQGSVFKLRVGSIVTYTTLYSFTGGSDGYWPNSNVVFDANGNLYGTTYAGGPYGDGGYGGVWELTP